MARKASHSWLEEGDVLDGYVVDRPLDDHPGVEVRYSARARDGRPVTVVTSRRPFTDRHDRARFRRLARVRMELVHPALIRVRAFGEHGEQPYVITDEYPRRTFGDVLARDAPFDAERVVTTLAPVAEALDLAHQRGLVHQALDSDSLLVVGDERLLLDSFGATVRETHIGWQAGQLWSLRYRAPEQIRGEPFGLAASVYALTALIVHALTGQAPYHGDRATLTYAHLAEAPPRVTERAPWLNGEIDAVVEWGMAKDPSERPESAAELLRATALAAAPLGRLAKPLPSELSLASVAERPGPAKPARRRRWRAIGLAVVAIAVAAAGGVFAGAALDPFGDETPVQTAPSANAGLWQRVADRRAELRTELAAADTPQDQAAAANDLAALYDQAADAGRPGRLTGAARAAATEYSQLASAASANDENAFADARNSVDAAEARLTAVARSSGGSTRE
jgi:hypothetical protein